MHVEPCFKSLCYHRLRKGRLCRIRIHFLQVVTLHWYIRLTRPMVRQTGWLSSPTQQLTHRQTDWLTNQHKMTYRQMYGQTDCMVQHDTHTDKRTHPLINWHTDIPIRPTDGMIRQANRSVVKSNKTDHTSDKLARTHTATDIATAANGQRECVQWDRELLSPHLYTDDQCWG